MSKHFKGTLVTGNINQRHSRDFHFESEEELSAWMADLQPGEERHKHTAPHVVRSGHHAVKRYKWEAGSLVTEIEGFDTLEEAKAYVESFEDHHLAKIYNPDGELLHESGPLATTETYA